MSYFLTVEELSRWCASTGVIVSAHSSLVCDPIYRFGSEEQKQKFLPDLLSGKKIGSFSLTESNAGSDSGATQTTAKFDGTNWVLNGSKLFATNGKEADIFILIASTDPALKTRGVTAFIVDKNTPGYRIGKVEQNWHPLILNYEIILENVVDPRKICSRTFKGFKVQ